MLALRYAASVTALMLATTLASAAAAQAPLPRAPGAHVVTITPPGQTGAEPSIAVNPMNPAQIVAGDGAWAAHSTHPRPALPPGPPPPGGGRPGGDPLPPFYQPRHTRPATPCDATP